MGPSALGSRNGGAPALSPGESKRAGAEASTGRLGVCSSRGSSVALKEGKDCDSKVQLIYTLLRTVQFV